MNERSAYGADQITGFALIFLATPLAWIALLAWLIHRFI